MPHKFVTLDAMRGIAAIAVLQFHTSEFFGGMFFRHGYLAVDFFFMLSGFVLTFAYQGKLDRGWSGSSFLSVRAIRLYPLYLLGLVLGLLLRISENRFGHVLHFVSPCHLAILFALGLFLLPVPVQFAGVYPSSFPLNHPSWSLFYEILANIGHALFIRRRSQGTLVGTIFVSGIALIYSAIHLGSVGFGVNRVQLVYGFSRVLFSYSMGIFLCRVWHTGKLRVKVSPVLCGLFFLLVLVGPRSISGQMIYDLLVTMVVFPVILLVSASSQVHARLIAPFQMLGTASYAIYVLHVPLASFYSRIWLRARGVETSSDAPWPGLLFLALTIALALFIDRVYDLPVRAFLTKRFRTDRGF